jgi:hypothetical protein
MSERSDALTMGGLIALGVVLITVLLAARCEGSTYATRRGSNPVPSLQADRVQPIHHFAAQYRPPKYTQSPSGVHPIGPRCESTHRPLVSGRRQGNHSAISQAGQENPGADGLPVDNLAAAEQWAVRRSRLKSLDPNRHASNLAPHRAGVHPL